MRGGWVWVDFENTPHVLFLEPIVRRLVADGWRVACTAKPQSQTLALAARRGLEARPVGQGDFRGLPEKVVGTAGRAAALAWWAARQGRPRLLVSCSRSASLAAWALRVPGVALLDYEHAEQRALALSSRVIWLPDALHEAPLPAATRDVARFYEGLKENLYLDAWPLDRADARRAHGVAAASLVVVARPPAETAHYGAEPGANVWLAAVRALAARPGAVVLVSPRTSSQRTALGGVIGETVAIRFLEEVVDGPDLVAAADLVVGGGGTMNREAAVLGVPVWSTFAGPPPRIDEQLAAEGRLRWVRTMTELEAAVAAPVPTAGVRRGPYPGGLDTIFNDIRARLEQAVR